MGNSRLCLSYLQPILTPTRGPSHMCIKGKDHRATTLRPGGGGGRERGTLLPTENSLDRFPLFTSNFLILLSPSLVSPKEEREIESYLLFEKSLLKWEDDEKLGWKETRGALL